MREYHAIQKIGRIRVEQLNSVQNLEVTTREWRRQTTRADLIEYVRVICNANVQNYLSQLGSIAFMRFVLQCDIVSFSKKQMHSKKESEARTAVMINVELNLQFQTRDFAKKSEFLCTMTNNITDFLCFRKLVIMNII